jgi:hypothetical protein
MRKFILASILFGLVLISAFVLSFRGGGAQIEDCFKTKTIKISSDPAYRAELTLSDCAWGFGTAANFADVKVTLYDGYIEIPIESPSGPETVGLPGPTIDWTSAHTLTINVASRTTKGTLETQHPDLKIIRHYHLQD